jgi:two-component sensor histidine kinase
VLAAWTAHYAPEYRIIRADTNEERWLIARGEPIRGPGGTHVGLRGINMDITDRKRAEEMKALLMREVDHRARNILAVVLSLIRLSPQDDPARFVATMQGRITALAKAHTLLARGRWHGATVEEVAAEELDAYRGSARLSLQGPPVALRAGAQAAA